MVKLTVELEGRQVPIESAVWVFREACGCPYGVANAAMPALVVHGQTIPAKVFAINEEQAWAHMYDSKKEREKHLRAGERVELMSHERYMAEVSLALRTVPRVHTCTLGPVDRSNELPGQADLFEDVTP